MRGCLMIKLRVLELLEKKLNAIDRFIDYGRGDYKI